jgi:Rrf2 family transcriptional regulator, nitric oxide-sensitive transcriptional repressor
MVGVRRIAAPDGRGRSRNLPPRTPMRITLYTDYALRVLIYLGLRGDRLSTIRDIADGYGISRNHLMKLVSDLQQRGYVETLRGRNGGLRLQRAPEQINLGELVRATEQDLCLMECFKADNGCVITPHCDLKFILDEALRAFLGVLDGYTLADLLSPRRSTGLRRALTLPRIPSELQPPARPGGQKRPRAKAG